MSPENRSKDTKSFAAMGRGPIAPIPWDAPSPSLLERLRGHLFAVFVLLVGAGIGLASIFLVCFLSVFVF